MSARVAGTYAGGFESVDPPGQCAAAGAAGNARTRAKQNPRDVEATRGFLGPL